jgi:hypothetical protein
MKDILETLQALQDTPVPNLLIIGGVIFLFLAFVGRFGAYIELPRRRQRWAGIVGALLLVFGIVLFMVPSELPPSAPALVPSAEISTPSILTVQIWDVVKDQKNKLVVAKQFNISGSDETLQQVGQWVVEQITQVYNLTASSIRVHIYVPADLSNENLNIQMLPPIPYQIYFSVVAGPGKSRIPVANQGDQALARINQDFDLEITPIGYTIQTIHVTWGQPLDEDLVLESRPVAIAVEEFTGGQNSYATRVANYLTTNPRFAIKDPGALNQLRQQIATEQAYIAANPVSQTSIRTSLGVDLIVIGALEKP